MRRWLNLSMNMLMPLTAVVIGAALLLFDPPLLQTLRQSVFDQYQRVHPRVYQSAPVRIIDIDEESLFDLAWKRKGTLWAALCAGRAERPEWAAAHAVLEVARQEAEAGPFTFVSRLLGRLDGEGRSMRQRLLTRLGREAEDGPEEPRGPRAMPAEERQDQRS